MKNDASFPVKDRLLEDIQRHAALSSKEEAELVLERVLEALGECLDPNDRRAVSTHLPSYLRSYLTRSNAQEPHAQLANFYARVAKLERISYVLALEHATSVLRALFHRLPDEIVTLLRARLPSSFEDLFQFTENAVPPHSHADRNANRETRQTLASGREGSTHPLSDSAPEKAQRASVVRSSNPHGDTKLSSSGGTPSERKETLSSGRPGSKRPLSGSR